MWKHKKNELSSSMRHPVILIGSFVMILTAVICTFGALISAFSFTVDYGLLLIVWSITALALSTLATFMRGKGMLVLAPPALAMIIWKLPEIIEGGKWVVFFISREFNKWIFVPIIFPDAGASGYEQTLFFAAFGVVLAFLLTIAICLRRSSLLTVLITAPIVFINFILHHSQPDSWFLIGLLAVYLTLLISSSLHSDDFRKRGKAFFPSLALALLLLGSAYLLAPPENYRRETIIDPFDNYIRRIASQIGLAPIKFGVGWPAAFPGIWSFNTDHVDISDAGTRVITDQEILEITVSDAGTFYIRGYSMQYFDGRSWTVNSDKLFFLDEMAAMSFPAHIADAYMLSGQDDTSIKIKPVTMDIERTRDITANIAYTPYYSTHYPTQGISYNGLSNRYDVRPLDQSNGPQGEFSSVDFLYTTDSILEMLQALSPVDSIKGILAGYGGQSRKSYTQIESFTAGELRRLALEAGIDAAADREVVVDQVAEYIRSSGRYTLSPYVTPAGEDFALYFLEVSQQGYCIHFATAATMMLRALDIPARFTSGFAVTVPQTGIDMPFSVTDRSAHAWVEVYYDQAGWLPIEVTPAAAGSVFSGIGAHTPSNTNTPEDDSNQDGDGDNSDQTGDRDFGDRSPIVTVPNPEGDNAADAMEKTYTIWTIIVTVLITCITVCAIALIFYRPIALIYRKKRFAQKDTNAAVICVWRYITRINGKKQPPEDIEDIEELAFKARFSQHIINEDERTKVISYASKRASEAYHSGSIFNKIWLYIRGL